MHICLFEDNSVNFLEPLIYSRGVYDLICGGASLKNKILRAYTGVKYSLHCREYLAAIIKDKNPGISVNEIEGDSCLFINGRVIAGKDLANIIPLNDNIDKLYLKKNDLIAARLSGNNLKKFKQHLNKPLELSLFPALQKEEVEVKTAGYIWDLIRENGSEIILDINYLSHQNFFHNHLVGVHQIKKDNIFIEGNAVIKPGAVLDASNGPIYIGENSIIYPNSVILGPAYIGCSTLVKSLAKIYENVSVGDVCKVGGEIEGSIIMSYTNKQHDGFLGHAYLGNWINIGADTNCSDLKNNYGFVKTHVNGQDINTNTQFLGLIMGDHSKTGINTMFNTGTTVGFSCNIYGSGFPDKYLPSFSWGGSDELQTYDVNKCLETAKVVMSRRKIEFKKIDEDLFRKIFDLTRNERIIKGLTG
jgi:UDP-N-acetylglucosamine diphosphorylase / glucose-1-phosphate thymidylyltransferase / UDP-N-acetylgalactosamine diphosphorylase / glucosamine-1-phosphate N-acetyltransferase / galactosamine-1-phosphate N-acetyltransferase